MLKLQSEANGQWLTADGRWSASPADAARLTATEAVEARFALLAQGFAALIWPADPAPAAPSPRPAEC